MSTQKSISGQIGKGSIRHNNRSFSAKNVDTTRTKDDVILCNENLKDAYHKLFDEALTEYNAKQKRKDRRIPDYYEHIRTSKQEKLFYEVIFQIGNKDDTAVGTKDGEIASKILQEFYEKLKADNPHIHIFNAVIHMDEATPHLHIDFIPVATDSKRGLKTRNSLSKALEQQGFKNEGRFNTATKLWIDREKQRLAECMAEHNIEHEVKGIHRPHLSVEEFKLQERIKEVAEIEEKISEKTQALCDIDNEIDDKQSELDTISKKQLQIKNLDKIPVENTVIGDKVKLSRRDYTLLMDTSKKYYARKNTIGKLQTKISTLEQEKNTLRQTVTEQKKELSKLKSIRNKLNIGQLQKELAEVKALLNRVMEFIDLMGLRERLEKFLHPNRKHNKNIDR